MRLSKTSPRKENSSDNFYRDKPFQKSQFYSPKKPLNNLSKIPIPKIPTSKYDQGLHSLNDSEEIEKEIEAKLRLKLRAEYSQKYHDLQEQHDKQIFKLSQMLDMSFINNFSILNSYEEPNIDQNAKDSYSDEYEQEYEYEYEYDCDDYDEKCKNKQSLLKTKSKLENEISKQQKHHDEIEKKLNSNKESLEQLEMKLNQSELLQASEKKDQERFSAQIYELYSRYSNLMLELNARKERRQLETNYNNISDSYNGDINKVDFGLSIKSEAIENDSDSSQIIDDNTENDESEFILSESKPKLDNSLKCDLTPPILLDQTINSETSNTESNSMLIHNECLTMNSDRNDVKTVKIDPINSVSDSLFPTIIVSESSLNLHSALLSKEIDSESGIVKDQREIQVPTKPENNFAQKQNDELPNELFRAPYRIKIPIRPPK